MEIDPLNLLVCFFFFGIIYLFKCTSDAKHLKRILFDHYSPDTLFEGCTLTLDGWTLGLDGWTLAFEGWTPYLTDGHHT